jgi:mercuric reductase
MMRNSGATFDLAILGGGSASFAAAQRASALGARVLMVNAGPLGGTCVNIGCVPSKTLIRAAESYHRQRHSPFRSVEACGRRLHFAELIEEKRELVAELQKSKYGDVLAGLPHVRLCEGRGRLTGRQEFEVRGERYRAERILVATGSRPARPPISGLGDAPIWDSTTAMETKVLPKRLIVLGGRYIALELGQMFARLGSNVTLVLRSRHILPGEDLDVLCALEGYLAREGIEVRCEHQVTQVLRPDAGFCVRVQTESGTQDLCADAVLAALGRAPNTEGLGLESVGVELGPRGFVAVGEDLQSSVPEIYAAGDVIGEPLYVYAAAYEGALAAENALASRSTPRDYTALPWVIFTDPQLAGVGWNEQQAAARGIPVAVSTVPLTQVARARAAHDTRGFVKLLRARDEDRLIGARVLSPEGGEQIAEASLMIKFGLPVSAVARHFHAYLTQSEAVQLAALGFEQDVSKLSCCTH